MIRALLLYTFSWALMALTPGPAVICAMTHAARYGMRAALLAISGILLGHVVLFACVATGLAALIAQSSSAFQVLRWIGALYLIRLGVRAIWSARTRSPTVRVEDSPRDQRFILRGLAIQLSNPKALVFVAAFLPHFIQREASVPMQFSILLAITLIVDFAVLGGYAYVASRGATSPMSTRLRMWVEHAFGFALVLLGIGLLASAE